MALSLRKMRERAGLTQEEFGQQLGVDGQFVSNIERGVASLPPKHFPKVAELCKVEVKQLVAWSVARYKQRLNEKIVRK